MGTRPGPVKEAVAGFQAGFVDLLSGFAATAIEQGELPPGEDPGQLAFELNGICLAADANFVLHDNPADAGTHRQVLPWSNGAGAGDNVPTQGNDLVVVAGGVFLGLVFGVGAGSFTRVFAAERGIYAKAGPLAATFWTVGVVLRTAFSLYATYGGAGADRRIGHLMHSLSVTSSNAIVACLLLMVLVEVGSRQLIVGARYLRLRGKMSAPAASMRQVGAPDRADPADIADVQI